MLNAIDSAPARTAVGNSDGSVDGIVALKQMSDRPMMMRPAMTEPSVLRVMSMSDGNASTISMTEPMRTIVLRPMRSEARPMSGMIARQTAMTMICETLFMLSLMPWPPLWSVTVDRKLGMYAVSM